ncbi:hypothetical protein MPER_09754, partial [Moniliophthora perniciosa FA553]
AVLGFRAADSKNVDALFKWQSNEPTNFTLIFLAAMCYVASNCIADTVLVGHRSSSIYKYTNIDFFRYIGVTEFSPQGSRKRVIAAPVLASTVTNALGLGTSIMTALRTGYYATNAAHTFILTLMITGGIWWSSHDSRKYLGHSTTRQYQKVIAVVIESGLLYSSCLVAYVSVRENISNIGFPLDLFPLIVLMAGIAPTMIILRTSLGLSAKAVPNAPLLSTLRFEATPTATERVTNHSLHATELGQVPGDLEAQKEHQRAAKGYSSCYK